MKKMILLVAGFAILAAGASFGASLFAQGTATTPAPAPAAATGTKIAVVNVGAIFNGWKKATRFKDELERSAKPYNDKAKKLQEEIGRWKMEAQSPASVNCSVTPNTYAAFWVGLDGYSSSTVEQTGTDSDCSGKKPSYYAWYEFYPNPSIVISSVPVAPGDVMSAEVTYSGSEFTTKITNTTTGKSYTKSSKVSGAKRSSAEWIAEAPCCTNSGGILPLSDFGTVSFGLDYTGVTDSNYASDSTSGGLAPIGAFSTVESITMINGSTNADEAVPTALTADGTSFQVTWKSK